MKVTRDVILDLLPLYLDGEVSADTRAPVKAYKEAKRLMFQRTLVKSITISVLFLCTLGFIAVVWLGAARVVH